MRLEDVLSKREVLNTIDIQDSCRLNRQILLVLLLTLMHFDAVFQNSSAEEAETSATRSLHLLVAASWLNQLRDQREWLFLPAWCSSSFQACSVWDERAFFIIQHRPKNHSSPDGVFPGVMAARNWNLRAPPPWGDESAAAHVIAPHSGRLGKASGDAAGSKSSRRCEISQRHSSGHLCCVHISLQSVNTLNYCWICENEKKGDGLG